MGDLGYRTVDFKYQRGAFEQQGCGVINYSDLSVPYTRAHEHNYFSPWEQHERSVLVQEYSSECTRDSFKIYPKRMEKDMAILAGYQELIEQAVSEEKTSFIGRLGTYRYLDMQHCIPLSLDYADAWLAWKAGKRAHLPSSASAL